MDTVENSTIENDSVEKPTTVENETDCNDIKKEDSPETKAAKELLIRAMHENRGNITNSCKAVGVNRSTYYRYAKEDKDFKDACSDVLEMNLDFVEDKLFKSIEKGDLSSIYFYLKCKGKKRGYIEGNVNFNMEMNEEDKQVMDIGGKAIVF